MVNPSINASWKSTRRTSKEKISKRPQGCNKDNFQINVYGLADFDKARKCFEADAWPPLSRLSSIRVSQAVVLFFFSNTQQRIYLVFDSTKMRLLTIRA